MTKDSENYLENITSNDEHSSDNDHSYKINHKSIPKRPKPTLKCVVCGDNAFGYNFDAISCESCKAFFRRSALRPPGNLKCRAGGHCEVTVERRKRCKRCRLDKCFRMGMRKEWILTDEEKKKKRRQIEENRHRKKKHIAIEDSPPRPQKNSKVESDLLITTSNSTPTDDIPPMTTSDWTKIDQIQYAYSQSIVLNKVVGVPTFPATQPIHSTVELIRIPTYLASIRLITFLKQIPEFQLFDPDDRVTLVKHNLLAVVFMHTVLTYNPKYDTYHEQGTEDPIFEGKDWIDILGEEFYHSLTNVITKLIRLVQSDRVIIKTLLLLILFTKGFCGYDIVHEPTLKNYSIVFQTQNSYLETIFKYCLHHYGLSKTLNIFSTLLSHLLSIQNLAIHLKDYVHNHIDITQVSPLMQTVLQLDDSSRSST